MAVEVLAEYYIIQKEYGPKIMSFITEHLGSFTVIEHFNNFYRFKLDTEISIGAVFGAFEDEVQG
jgi:ATP-binding cassette, subfamily A (ABC1), member 3